jgi:hypothetical protein
MMRDVAVGKDSGSKSTTGFSFRVKPTLFRFVTSSSS